MAQRGFKFVDAIVLLLLRFFFCVFALWLSCKVLRWGGFAIPEMGLKSYVSIAFFFVILRISLL